MWNLDSVSKLSSRTLRRLLYGNYRNLGIYVDTQCDSQNYTVIYSEVKETTLSMLMKKQVLGENLKYIQRKTWYILYINFVITAIQILVAITIK